MSSKIIAATATRDDGTVEEYDVKAMAAEYVPIAHLKGWKDNPRKNDQAVQPLMDSIKRFGFAAPVVARKADKMIIAGHTRVKAALELRLTDIPVRYLDISEEDAKLLALADNKLGEIAKWDEAKLSAVLRELDEAGADLEGLGWIHDEVDELIEDMVEEPVEPEVPFSEFIGESHNYVVLLFDNEIDWLSALTHFDVSPKMSRRDNGTRWKRGTGRVIDGASYLTKMTQGRLDGLDD